MLLFDRAAFLPAVDITVGEHDLVMTLDVPGVAADSLEIQLLDGDLVVRGERKRPELAEGTTWVHHERGFGAFERRVRLPDGVDADAITASLQDGVLSLIVPKPERMKPKTIAIAATEERRELETTTA